MSKIPYIDTKIKILYILLIFWLQKLIQKASNSLLKINSDRNHFIKPIYFDAHNVKICFLYQFNNSEV